MKGANKFLFETDFGQAGTAAGFQAQRASAAEQEREALTAQAHAAGFAEGHEAGYALGLRDSEQRLMQVLDDIARIGQDLIEQLDRFEMRSALDAQRFAMQFAKTLAGQALERFPLAELEASARQVFGELRQAPHVVVQIDEALIDKAEPMLARAARERGFEGRLVVLGEADMAHGDFRIEWADGGMERSGEAIAQAIENAVMRHLPETMV